MQCPISSEIVDERGSRISAFIVVLVSCISLYLDVPILFALLAIDFFIKGFVQIKKSPLAYIVRGIITALSLSPKPTNAGPKQFAAKIGFILSVLAFVLGFLGYKLAFLICGFALIIAAGLQAFIGFCVGCLIYSLWMKCEQGLSRTGAQ